MTRARTALLKCFAVLMIFVSVFSATAIANAQTDDNYDDLIAPQYSTIQSNTTGLIIRGIKANCVAAVVAQYETSLKIKMELQKKKSTGYETVETWTGSRYGVSLAMSESRLINVFSDYRLKATFTAGSETTVVYKYPS